MKEREKAESHDGEFFPKQTPRERRETTVPVKKRLP
jgi:hypothetical protein